MSSPQKALRIVADGLAFPEGLGWHEGAFYFSDIHDYHVRRIEAFEVEAARAGLS